MDSRPESAIANVSIKQTWEVIACPPNQEWCRTPSTHESSHKWWMESDGPNDPSLHWEFYSDDPMGWRPVVLDITLAPDRTGADVDFKITSGPTNWVQGQYKATGMLTCAPPQ